MQEANTNLRALGRTILLTTHYMDEAQNLADRAAVIAEGHIVAEGTPEAIGGRSEGAATITFLAAGLSREQLPAEAQPAFDDASGLVTIETPNPTAVLNTLTGWALERGVELEALSVARPSLEDVYLQLTGEGN